LTATFPVARALIRGQAVYLIVATFDCPITWPGQLLSRRAPLAATTKNYKAVGRRCYNSKRIVGSFTNANPISPLNEADSSVSRLLFSGLMSYNSDNQLVATWLRVSR